MPSAAAARSIDISSRATAAWKACSDGTTALAARRPARLRPRYRSRRHTPPARRRSSDTPGRLLSPGWITDLAELARILAEAGFRDAEARKEATTFRYDDLEQYWRNAPRTGERRRLVALDAKQEEQLWRALAERLQPVSGPSACMSRPPACSA
jgi:hypothetical protein